MKKKLKEIELDRSRPGSGVLAEESILVATGICTVEDGKFIPSHQENMVIPNCDFQVERNKDKTTMTMFRDCSVFNNNIKKNFFQFDITNDPTAYLSGEPKSLGYYLIRVGACRDCEIKEFNPLVLTVSTVNFDVMLNRPQRLLYTNSVPRGASVPSDFHKHFRKKDNYIKRYLVPKNCWKEYVLIVSAMWENKKYITLVECVELRTAHGCNRIIIYDEHKTKAECVKKYKQLIIDLKSGKINLGGLM